MGYPTFEEAATEMGVPMLQIDAGLFSTAGQAAGNAMHVASIYVALLCALTCIG